MEEQLFEVYDRKGDFLGTCTSEEQLEVFCRNAREMGFNPILREELFFQ